MELFQELLFTISLSLIVSLLIAKLFAAASTSDDGGSVVSVRVEKKIEKEEWVVCDSEKDVGVEDPVKVSEEVDLRHVDAELGSGVVVNDVGSVGGVGVCQVFDEMPERTELNDSVEIDEGNVVESSASLIQESCVKSIDVQHESSAFDEVFDDDWQGIETTELDKRFGAAVAFMDSKSGADRLNLVDNEVKIQLYGLHKVAIEGSCFEPQPMALKVSARANWNSWKRLENLGREDAMEQYIALLSQHVPDWMDYVWQAFQPCGSCWG